MVVAQVQEVAVGYEIYERTNSKLALAWIGLAQAVPLLCLILPAGHLADRFDRRRIIMITQAAWVASAIGLAVLSHLQGPIPLMYLMLAIGAGAHAVGWPARSSLLPQIVPPSVFNNAVEEGKRIFSREKLDAFRKKRGKEVEDFAKKNAEKGAAAAPKPKGKATKRTTAARKRS